VRKAKLPGLDLAIGAYDSQTEEESATEMILSFRHVLVTPEPYGIGNHAIRGGLTRESFIAFLEIGVAPAINIERAVRNILDAKNGRLAGGLIRRRILRASDANVKMTTEQINTTRAEDGLKKRLVASLPAGSFDTLASFPLLQFPKEFAVARFYLPRLQKREAVSRVNSYDSCNKSSGRTSYRRSRSDATCPADEQLVPYGT